MERPLYIGVVGIGAVSLRGIIPHLVQDDIQHRVRIKALCDVVGDQAGETARKFGIPQFFSDYDTFLREADVDLITLATPIGLHYQQGKAALLAGKHVHFNKTMTVTRAEADELIALAHEHGLHIVASPGEMLRPHNQAIKRLIEDGKLGKLSWAICGAAFERYHEDEPERASFHGTPAIDPAWYFKSPGGGPLYDMTVYALHGLTGILGSVKRVTALSGIRIAERNFKGHAIKTECHDNTIMLLDFGSNLFAAVYGTAAGGLRTASDFSGSYFGTEGAVMGMLCNGQPFEYEGRSIAVSAPDGRQWILPNVVGVHRDIPEQHVYADIMQLVDWVREGAPSVVTAEHARHVIEIIELAFASADTGIAQNLKTSLDGLVLSCP